jgi:8-oxo-dGTP pyrophosphatase MutT (NUDIX family)
MSKKEEILYSDNWFDVVKIETQKGFKMKKMTVAVMPFITNENGLITEIGLLHELNYFREGDYCDTLITGTVEYEDDSLLLTAIRELKEEGGYSLPEDNTDRWVFLGPLYPYKDSDYMIAVFAVDVTGIEKGKATGDGSKKEELSELKMVDVSNGLSTNESIVLGSFLRLFNYMYAKTMNYV